MKKCNMCGSQVNDNLNVCPNCGNPNLVVENVSQGQPVPGPMPQQPMPGPMPVQGNMPMTFATVFMVILGLGALSSLGNLISDFSLGTLVGLAFNVCTIYFLAKRAKVGRTLAMIYSVIEAVAGGLAALAGLLFMVGLSAAFSEVAGLAALGAAVGFVFLLVGGGLLAFGICSFIYFKKRACMYIN